MVAVKVREETGRSHDCGLSQPHIESEIRANRRPELRGRKVKAY